MPGADIFFFLQILQLKWEGFKNDELKSMPSNLLCGTDNKLLYSAIKSFDPSGIRLPFVVVADKEWEYSLCFIRLQDWHW